jgi:hypothetical protein
MSVRASLEADTVASAGFNRKQTLSDIRSSTATALSDVSQGSYGSDFRHSLEEHFASTNCETEKSGSDEIDTKSSSLFVQHSVQEPMDGADKREDFAQLAEDYAKPGETVPNHLDARSRTKSLSPATLQKQTSITRQFRTALAFGSKGPVPLDTTKKNVNDVPEAATATALLNSILPVSALYGNGPISSALVASSVPIENNATASISSTTGLKASGLSIPSGTSRKQTANSRIPFASSQSDNRTEGNDGPNANLPEFGTDHARSTSSGTPKSSEVNVGTKFQIDTPALRNVAGDDVMCASGGNQQSGFDRASISNNSTVAVSQPSPGRVESKAQTATASEDANGGFKQLPADGAECESVRDSCRSTKGDLQAAGSGDVVRSIKVPKLASARSESNDRQSQNTKGTLLNAPDAFTLHSLDVARISEGTNAGSTTQKAVDATSSDSRLQNTFAALEPGTWYHAGALNWTRAGHLQAEAGYQDPELGWIGVRAETIGGVVHATLSPQSSDAAQALSGHLAGLHTHLSDNRTPVGTLTLAPFGEGAHQFAGQESGQGGRNGTGQNHNRNDTPEPALQVHSNARLTHGAHREMSSAEGILAGSNTGTSSGGSRISVLA